MPQDRSPYIQCYKVLDKEPVVLKRLGMSGVVLVVHKVVVVEDKEKK